jgi:predicted DNA-binding protein (MmcQ/YjbR family)
VDLDAYNRFCATLTAATHQIQWGDHDVWKVGGKVFAIAGQSPDGVFTCTFKVEPMHFDMLCESPGLRPAPYLASRGLTWVQSHQADVIADSVLEAYLARSHAIVGAGLSKKQQVALGLLAATPPAARRGGRRASNDLKGRHGK